MANFLFVSQVGGVGVEFVLVLHSKKNKIDGILNRHIAIALHAWVACGAYM